MTVYYNEATTYKAGILAASEDRAFFEEDERNALRGAYYALVCQNNRILPSQKRIGNHKSDARIEELNFTVYFGWAETGGVYVEVQRCPHNRTNRYYLSGLLPVRIIWEPKGHCTEWVYSWETGVFEKNHEYVTKSFHSGGDVEEIDEETFINEVGALREKLFGAKEEAERERLRQSAFASFEADCRKRILGYPESLCVMEALNRVLAIRWEEVEKPRRSHELLLREACRRLALYIQKMNLRGNGPLFNAAEYVLPGDRISEQIKELLEKSITDENNRNVCLWFIHWEQAAEQADSEKLQEQNPYEPLIYLFERGGSLEFLRQIWAENSFGGLTLDELENMPAAVRLDFEALNRVDEI